MKNKTINSKIYLVVAIFILFIRLFGVAQALEFTAIEVHALNPEGIDIGSVEYDRSFSGRVVEVFSGDDFVGFAEHDQLIRLDPGNHTIRAIFNGIELSKIITLKENELKKLVFVFPRVEFDFDRWMHSLNINGEVSCSNQGQCTDFCTYWHHSLCKSCQSLYTYKTTKLPFGESIYAYCPNVGDFASTRIDVTGKGVSLKSYESGSGSTGYATKGSGYYQSPIIPAYSSFDSWIVQQRILSGCSYQFIGADENYPQPGSEIGYILPQFNEYTPKYKTIKYDASRSVNYINFFKPNFLSCGDGNTSFELKMGSIPYDITGTGTLCSERFGVNYPPVAAFKYVPKSPFISQKIYFDVRKSSDKDGWIKNYKLDYGDGTTTSSGRKRWNGSSPTKIYDNAGTYTVALTVTDNDGLTNIHKEVVEVYDKPIVKFLDPDNSEREVEGAVADGASEVFVQVEGLIESDSVWIDPAEGEWVDKGNIVDGVYRRKWRAPEYFVRPGDTTTDDYKGDIKEGLREIEFEVYINNVPIEHDPFYLYKPPVVLLHGLWADASTWTVFENKLKDDYGYKHVINKPYDNSIYFESNKAVILVALSDALRLARADEIVAKKVDVVGHSMGGILAKRFGNEKYIKSITTVGTPHFGSRTADFLWPLVFDSNINPKAKAIELALNWLKHPPKRGAVEDLRVVGGKHCGIAGISCFINVPYNVISGISSHLDQLEDNFLDLLLNIAKLNGFIKPSDDLTVLSWLIFGEQKHDFIVRESSQEGGNTGAIDEAVGWHCTESKDPGVMDIIVDFLHKRSNTASSSQSRQTIVTEIPFREYQVPEIKMGISQGQMQITNPAEGELFQNGVIVNVTVDVSSEDAMVLIASSSGESILLESAPYNYQFVVPEDAVGELTFIAMATDEEGYIGSEEISINIAGSAELTSMTIYPAILPLTLPVGLNVPLSVTGLYTDSVTRDITYSASGTIYTSSDPSVAIVSEDGMITGVSPGETQIDINNSLIRTIDIKVIGSEITVTPELFNFNVIEAESEPVTFTVENTGYADLDIGEITIAGTDFTEFKKQNDNCSGKILTLSSTCIIDIVFAPATKGIMSAELTIPSNDNFTPLSTIQLKGISLVEGTPILTDSDNDSVLDDGDSSGTISDNPCIGGNTAQCDDNCIDTQNSDQADADSNGVGDACEPELFHLYDVNLDWTIGDFELLDAIDDWAMYKLGDFELLDLIDFWDRKCYRWDASALGYKAGCQ